jgi:hypothetical protein
MLIGLPPTLTWGARLRGATIVLSGASVAEDAATGTLVGTLSVAGGSGSYTFSITADPDNKFALDGDDLELDATLDYETATFHTVTIEADNGVDDPISRTFSIQVIDASEGPVDGLQLESGDFLLAENGDYLIQEAA